MKDKLILAYEATRYCLNVPKCGVNRVMEQLRLAFLRRTDVELVYTVAEKQKKTLRQILGPVPISTRRHPLPFDVFLSAIYPTPNYIINNRQHRPYGVVLHDRLAEFYPQNFPPLSVELLKQIDRQLTPGTVNFANSACTKRDFLNAVNLPEEDITIIPLAADEHFRPVAITAINQSLQRLGLPPNLHYLLFIATIEERKNQILAIQAFLRLAPRYPELHFVIGGESFPSFTETWNRFLKTIPEEFRPRIHLLGRCPDEALPALYSGAIASLYLSQYEGFGLPLVESMQCGCPVIAADSSCLPEVVGDAGILTRTNDLDDVERAIERILTDPGLRAELSRRGLVRAREFSWDRAAEIIVKKFREALVKHPPHASLLDRLLLKLKRQP